MPTETPSKQPDRATAPAPTLAAIRAATSKAWHEGPSAEDRASWPLTMKRYLNEDRRRRFALDPWDPVNLALPDTDFVPELVSRIADKAHRVGRAGLNDLELALDLRSAVVEGVCANGFKKFFKSEEGDNWEAQVLVLQFVDESALAAVVQGAGEVAGKAGPAKKRLVRKQIAEASGESFWAWGRRNGAGNIDPLDELTSVFIFEAAGPSPVAKFIRLHVREFELPLG